MSISQQLARNRAVFTALADREEESREKKRPEVAKTEDWRLVANAASHRATQPASTAPIRIVQSSETTTQPLQTQTLSIGQDSSFPLPHSTVSVYSLDQPPATREWKFAEHTVPLPSPEPESVSVITDICFPELPAESFGPAPSAAEPPLQALLRQLETDARRSPQLHTEEERL